MDSIETPETEEISLGKELATAFVRQTVSSAAVWTGLGLVLFAASKIISIRDARKDKKNHIKS